MQLLIGQEKVKYHIVVVGIIFLLTINMCYHGRTITQLQTNYFIHKYNINHITSWWFERSDNMHSCINVCFILLLTDVAHRSRNWITKNAFVLLPLVHPHKNTLSARANPADYQPQPKRHVCLRATAKMYVLFVEDVVIQYFLCSQMQAQFSKKLQETDFWKLS